MTFPEQWVETGRVELIKHLDPEGNIRWGYRFDDGVTSWEAVGAMEDYKYCILREVNDD